MRGWMESLEDIRSSFKESQELFNREEDIRSDKWYARLDKSKWLFHVQCALETANLALRSLQVLCRTY